MPERPRDNFEGFSLGEDVSYSDGKGGIITGGTITGFDKKNKKIRIFPSSEANPSLDRATIGEHVGSMQFIDMTIDDLLAINPRK